MAPLSQFPGIFPRERYFPAHQAEHLSRRFVRGQFVLRLYWGLTRPMHPPDKPATGRLRRENRRFGRGSQHPRGVAQLSLVEHALCPLDATGSLAKAGVFESQYSYTDASRRRRRAEVRVTCPEGLSASDEFYLWGLLGLTFSQPGPTLDFYATPYYCLRQLGCIDAASKRGGKNYELFRRSLRRLAAVTYSSDAFYDPIRREHRGPYFDQASPAASSPVTDSPLHEPLHTIGLDDATICRILDRYDARLVAKISDMTLAAGDKFGPSFFKRSPQAYFIDNLKAQAARKRTAPDWWRELRKAEELMLWNASTAIESDDHRFQNEFDAYLETEARDGFDRVMHKIFADFKAAGQSDVEARENAERHARTHFRHRFFARRSHAPHNTMESPEADA
jgi:hypothetical protein